MANSNSVKAYWDKIDAQIQKAQDEEKDYWFNYVNKTLFSGVGLTAQYGFSSEIGTCEQEEFDWPHEKVNRRLIAIEASKYHAKLEQVSYTVLFKKEGKFHKLYCSKDQKLYHSEQELYDFLFKEGLKAGFFA